MNDFITFEKDGHLCYLEAVYYVQINPIDTVRQRIPVTPEDLRAAGWVPITVLEGTHE